MGSGEHFGISFMGKVKKMFFGKRETFGNFSRERGNTDPLEASPILGELIRRVKNAGGEIRYHDQIMANR